MYIVFKLISKLSFFFTKNQIFCIFLDLLITKTYKNLVNLENNMEGVGGGLNKLNEHQNESNITKSKSGPTNRAATGDINDEELNKTELRKVNNHRHSNESGTL